MTAGTSTEYVFIPNACRTELFRHQLTLGEAEMTNICSLEAET